MDIQSEIDIEKRKPKNEQSELKRLALEREVISRKIQDMEQFTKGGGVDGIDWYKYDGQYEAEFGNFYLYVIPSNERGRYYVRVTDGYRGDLISESTQEILGLDNAKDLAYDIVGDYMKQFSKGGVVFTNYNGSEIMYEPNYDEYFVNDEVFDSMESAKRHIDYMAKSNGVIIDYYNGYDINIYPKLNEYWVNDEIKFNSMEDAKNYIDTGEMENDSYGFGGGLLVGSLVGGYLGYKIGKYNKQTLSSGFDTEKRIGNDIKNKLQGKKTFNEGGGVGEMYVKGGGISTFNPMELIGKYFIGKFTNGDIINVRILSNENIRIEYESNNGGLIVDKSFTKEQLFDMINGKRINDNIIVTPSKTMDEGGEVDGEEKFRYKDFYQSQGGIKFKTEEEAERFIKTTKPFVRKQLREGNFVLVFNGKEYFIGEKIKINDEYADGGEVDTISDEDLLRIKLAVAEAQDRIKANDKESESGGSASDITNFIKENPQLLMLLEKGGSVGDENYEMLKNKVTELLHHSKELQAVVKKKPKTPAWVISKSSRASTDLSDITHYLEGKL
jgi:hypothetical protein